MIGKNNPFNIRTSAFPWKGQLGSTRGFCDFTDIRFGIRAAIYLLVKSYRRKGINTIESIITRFAPVSENDTSRYIKYICKNTGFFPDCPLLLNQYILVLRYISCFEGNPVSYILIQSVYEEFKTDFQY